MTNADEGCNSAVMARVRWQRKYGHKHFSRKL